MMRRPGYILSVALIAPRTNFNAYPAYKWFSIMNLTKYFTHLIYTFPEVYSL